MPPNQVHDIWMALRILQHASLDDLVDATGWNRHVIELTMALLVEKGMARCINADAGEPRYEVISR